MGGSHDTSGVVAAVVTVVFDRPDYLKRHAESLLAVHGSDPLNRCAPGRARMRLNRPRGVAHGGRVVPPSVWRAGAHPPCRAWRTGKGGEQAGSGAAFQGSAPCMQEAAGVVMLDMARVLRWVFLL